MKQNRLIAGVIIAIFLISFSSNPPNGNTGAPFDGSTCAQSGCHSGTSSIQGSVTIMGLPQDAVPGQTYPFKVALSVSVGTAGRGGFQMVAVDDNNNNSGIIQNLGSNTGTEVFGGRTYLEHRNAKNFNGNLVEYEAEWVAPPSTQTTTTTFYIAANLANGNGGSSGDRIVTNSLTLDIVAPNVCEVSGGTLSGGPFEFCVGDGVADNIAADGISLSGNSGGNTQWVVTDANGMILGLPDNFADVDFDGAGAGTCLVWHLSYEDGLTGLSQGANTSGLQGCFSLSNSVTVNRSQPEGGTLSGGPFEFCVGDGVADNIAADGISLSGNSGGNTQWVVTDPNGMILGLPDNFADVDFDGAGAGTCLVWHLSSGQTVFIT